jgi:hypothetical protein
MYLVPEGLTPSGIPAQRCRFVTGYETYYEKRNIIVSYQMLFDSFANGAEKGPGNYGR